MIEPEIAQSHIEDQPPDPTAARAAALEARRMLAIYRGPLILLMGLSSGITTIPAFIWRNDSSLSGIILGVWGISMGVLGLAWPSIARRLSPRWGALALRRGERRFREPLSPATKIGMLAGLLVASGLAGVMLFLPSRWGPWIGLAVVTGMALPVASLLGWQAIRLRLWEMLLPALIVLLMPAAYLLGRSSNWEQDPWWVTLWMFLWLTPSGILLCLRWRKWVRSLPREDNGAEAQA